MATHIRAGLLATSPTRLRPLDEDTPINRTISLVMTPGHTPGSVSVRIDSLGGSLWLVGDAITCPVQLAEPSWHSFGDVLPERAEASRRMLWKQLAFPATRGVGSHFPGLVPGHVDAANGPLWRPKPWAQHG
jgi:glyoxylase-like metal-dependent hydrolase (beta-lactamase superfamily II)